MASKVLIALNNDSQYLMIQRSQDKKWCFPNGEINSGHPIIDNDAKKILSENYGYRANLLKSIFKTKNNIHLFFCDNWIKEANLLLNRFTIGAGWFSMHEIFLLKENLIPWFHEILFDICFNTRHENLKPIEGSESENA